MVEVLLQLLQRLLVPDAAILNSLLVLIPSSVRIILFSPLFLNMVGSAVRSPRSGAVLIQSSKHDKNPTVKKFENGNCVHHLSFSHLPKKIVQRRHRVRNGGSTYQLRRHRQREALKVSLLISGKNDEVSPIFEY